MDLYLPRTNHERDKRTVFDRMIQPMLVELVSDYLTEKFRIDALQIGTTLFILIGLFGACSDQANGGAFNAAFSFGLSLMIFVASLSHIR